MRSMLVLALLHFTSAASVARHLHDIIEEQPVDRTVLVAQEEEGPMPSSSDGGRQSYSSAASTARMDLPPPDETCEAFCLALLQDRQRTRRTSIIEEASQKGELVATPDPVPEMPASSGDRTSYTRPSTNRLDLPDPSAVSYTEINAANQGGAPFCNAGGRASNKAKCESSYWSGIDGKAYLCEYHDQKASPGRRMLFASLPKNGPHKAPAIGACVGGPQKSECACD